DIRQRPACAGERLTGQAQPNPRDGDSDIEPPESRARRLSRTAADPRADARLTDVVTRRPWKSSHAHRLPPPIPKAPETRAHGKTRTRACRRRNPKPTSALPARPSTLAP